MKLRIPIGGGDPPKEKKTMIRLAPSMPPPAPNPYLNPFKTQDSIFSAAPMATQVSETPPVDDEPKVKYIDPKGSKSGSYSKKHIEGIIKASKAVGIDPYHSLSLALQESGLGSAPPKKFRGRVINPSLAQIIDFEPAQEKELEEKAKATGIDPMYLKLAITLRDKIKYGKQLGFDDEASQLQAYNGYGVLTKRQLGGADKAYGVPVGEGIDMKRNPLYGKRLLELKQGFMTNKEINDLINSK